MDGWMDVNYTVNRRAQSNSIKVDKHNHTHPSIRNTYVPSIKLPVRAVERERERTGSVHTLEYFLVDQMKKVRWDGGGG